VRNKLNPGARLNGADYTMTEVRFVTEAPHVNLSLSSLEAESVIRTLPGSR
jgi:hypothetical protein